MEIVRASLILRRKYSEIKWDMVWENTRYAMSDIGVMTYDDGGIYDMEKRKRHGQGCIKNMSLILSQIGLWKS